MAPIVLLKLLLVLLAIAVVLEVAARRLALPPAILLTLGGMALALLPIPPVVLDPDLALVLFLPPLLQSSAFFTVWRDFKNNLRPILLLAIGAVAFTTLVVGATLKLLVPGLPWAACFAFGAIVSPTDAVAAAAVLSRLRMPRRLVAILEGESLVNDATGLVLYRFAVAATLTGMFDGWLASGTFVLVALGGIAVGAAAAYGFFWLVARLHDPVLEIAASFLVAWASYIAAEQLGVSGVLATVTCGLLMGWHQHQVFSPATRVQARAAWEFVIFVLNSVVFVLIGLTLKPIVERLASGNDMMDVAGIAAIVTAVTILARFAWVWPATVLPRWLIPAVRRADPMPPASHITIISWAGMRGVVSLAAALALPEQFPARDLIQFLTFAVILGTLVIQGTTLAPLIRLLRVGVERRERAVPPEAQARAHLALAALRVVEERSHDPLDGAMAAEMLREYRDRADWADRTHRGDAAWLAERRFRLSLRLEALAAQRKALIGLHRASTIDDAVLHAIEHELDLEELRLRRQLNVAD